MKIRRVNAIGLANIMGLIYVVFGFIAGLVFAIATLMGETIVNLNTNMMNNMIIMPAGVGAAIIILAPIMYGIAGWISGLIIGALYNLVSSWIGGLEVQTDIRRK